MRSHYDFSKMKGEKNPYAGRLKPLIRENIGGGRFANDGLCERRRPYFEHFLICCSRPR